MNAFVRVVVLVLVSIPFCKAQAAGTCEAIATSKDESACNAANCAYCCNTGACYSTPQLAVAGGCSKFVQGLTCKESAKIALYAICPQLVGEATCIKSNCTFCCANNKCFGGNEQAENTGCTEFAKGMTCLEARKIKEKMVTSGISLVEHHWKRLAIWLLVLLVAVLVIVICCCIFSRKKKADPGAAPTPAMRESSPLLAKPAGSINQQPMINQPQQPPSYPQSQPQQPPSYPQSQPQQPPMFHSQPLQQPPPMEMQQMPSEARAPPAYEHPHATADVQAPPAAEPRPASDSFYRQPPYQVRSDGFPASREPSRSSGPASTGQRGSDRPGIMKKFPALGCDQPR